MKILLTGGAGFIGSHVADLCIQEGHDVVIIDDLSSGKPANIPPKASFYELSILNPKVKDVFKNETPDAIIHHAAQISVRNSVEDPIHDMEINIRGTLHLLQEAVLNNIKKFLFASTGGAIYGEHDYFPADEQHPPRPLSPYGIGKLAAEKYLYFFNKTYNLNYTSLRYSNVYGPRQDPHGEAGVVAIFTCKMLNNGEPIINGSGEQTRDYVFVKDVARANLLALNLDFVGEINIATGQETTVNRLFAILNELTQSNAPEKRGSQLPGEQFRSVLSWEKAKKELNWNPQVSLEDGLRQTVKFFQEVKKA
jgi:UDP-glucose 4-epimerase